MSVFSPQALLYLTALIFVSVVFSHLIKKNSTAIWFYVIQSSAITGLLILTGLEQSSKLLLLAIIATIAVKIFIAPYFFFQLIKKHQLKFSASTYLNDPLTLLVIAALIGLTQSKYFQPLVELAPAGKNLLLISIASILLSLFLIINRKGALSQMIGILSLENSIVSFAIAAGLEQNPGLQLGITFNILIWVIIASIFASMIYSKFGTLNVTELKHLVE